MRKNKTLAWRNAWDVPELTGKTKAALLERDSAKRAEMYEDLQKKVRETRPLRHDLPADRSGGLRKNVQGFKLGPTFDTNFVCAGHEVTDRKVRFVVARVAGSETEAEAPRRRASLSHGPSLRFLVVAAITYLGLLAVTFFIGRVIPIDPVLAIVGDRAPASVVERGARGMRPRPAALAAVPHLCEEARCTGDFGTSVLTTNPVMTGHPPRVSGDASSWRRSAPSSARVFGVPLGVLAAVKRGSLVDQIVRVIGLIGYSVPIFWLGLLALLVFYARLGWVAGPGAHRRRLRIHLHADHRLLPARRGAAGATGTAFRDIFAHIILPASLLGYFSLAYISRMTRSFMLNELGQEYIVAARAKGLSETRIIWGHALRNAAVPLVTVIALSYAGLLEGSVLTETVFAWPGLGLYITNSLQNADMNAVLGGTIVIGSRLHRHQSAVRPALPAARSEDAAR